MESNRQEGESSMESKPQSGSSITKPLPSPVIHAGPIEAEPVPLVASEDMSDFANPAVDASLTEDDQRQRIANVKTQCISQGRELCTSAVIAVRTAGEVVKFMHGVQAPTYKLPVHVI